MASFNRVGQRYNTDGKKVLVLSNSMGIDINPDITADAIALGKFYVEKDRKGAIDYLCKKHQLSMLDGAKLLDFTVAQNKSSMDEIGKFNTQGHKLLCAVCNKPASLALSEYGKDEIVGACTYCYSAAYDQVAKIYPEMNLQAPKDENGNFIAYCKW